MHHFSELDIWVVSLEIKRKLLGKRVKALRELDKEFFLDMEGGLGIFFSLYFGSYRVHLLERKALSREKRNLTQWNKFDLIKGFKLRDARVTRGERVLFILLERIPPIGQKERRILVLELLGKYTNLFILDRNGKILKMAKPLKKEWAKTRYVEVGMVYVPLPKRKIHLWNREGEGGMDYIKKHFPHLLNESQKKGIPFDDWLSQYTQKVERNPHGILYFDEKERPIMYLPAPLETLNMKYETFPLFSEAIHQFYHTLIIKKEIGEENGEKERERLIQKLKEEMERLKEESERDRRFAELILSHIGEIKKEDKEIIIDGIRIKIDPRLSPGQNAERYFEMYKKKKRGIEKLKKRLELLKGGLKEKEAPPTTEKPSAKEPYLVFESPSGFKVYVGKNARGNEKVTFVIASAKDLFFHVKGAPGAHVILKTGGIEPKEEDITFAATLALRFSKLKRDDKGVVIYTERKNVKRAKGAQKGTVIVKGEKTVKVRLVRNFTEGRLM